MNNKAILHLDFHLSAAVSELDTRAEGEREEEGGTDGKTHLKRMGAAIIEVKDALVSEVDNMEERVCSASLQVKVCVALWVETEWMLRRCYIVGRNRCCIVGRNRRCCIVGRNRCCIVGRNRMNVTEVLHCG